MNHHPPGITFAHQAGKMMPKYKIKECLNRLSIYEYRILVKAMPGYLGRTINTFWNYTRIPVNSKIDIPYGTVRMLEILFGLRPGELINIPINGKPCAQVIKEADKRATDQWVHLETLEDDDL
ncbi:hypothetical protein HDE69_002028 [Pedobacter cryoconitis]|uniref:Uncharacterized protein n=1 Tax=Pedobacter cryoconitis TaxID=188932 RepID=A0A7W8YSF9_9SPHI|nr:hypothetical protein [Pedobacter cryoconitis]MBB5620975.1 hypothetical protein [Pedobacter cryoconitis]